MAFVKLTKEQNPKLSIEANNALNYKTKEGEIKQRDPKYALTEVCVEAGKVAGMGKDKGNVVLGVEVNGKYENYFVNRMKDDNSIVLKPTDTVQDKSTYVYINRVENKQTGKAFYAINDAPEYGGANGARLVQGLGVQDKQNDDGSMSHYVKANIRLANDELKQALTQKGEGYVAILSKEGYKIVSEEELQKKAQEKKAPAQKKTTKTVKRATARKTKKATAQER